MFRLPKLTWELDCEPLGYPGLVLVMWLNPTREEWVPLDTDAPWNREYYWMIGRVIQEVRVPGGMTESGEPEVLEVDNGEDVWALEQAPGFDPQIITWAMRQYAGRRDERLQAESKN